MAKAVLEHSEPRSDDSYRLNPSDEDSTGPRMTMFYFDQAIENALEWNG